MKRSLFVAGFTYLGATALSVVVGYSASFVGVFLFAMWWIVLLQIRSRSPLLVTTRIIVFTCAVAMGAFNVYTALVIAPIAEFDEKNLIFQGQLIDRSPSRTSFTLIVKGSFKDVEDAPQNLKMKLYTRAEQEFIVGEMLEFEVTTTASLGRTIYERSLLAQGIVLTGYTAKEISTYPSQTYSLEAQLANYRITLYNSIKAIVPSVQGDIMAAMVLGTKETIPQNVLQNFRRSGISHILSISGLHLSVLMGLLIAFLQFIHIPNKLCYGIGIAAAILYAMLTGLAPSVTRAGIMISLYLLAKILDRRSDSLNSLGIAVMLITMINPYASISAGLILSCFSVLSIILFLQPIEQFLYAKMIKSSGNNPTLVQKFFVTTLSITVAANFLTIPFNALFFGWFNVVSPIVNMLIAPFVTLILICSILTALLGLFPALVCVSVIPGAIGAACATVLQDIALFWGELPFSALDVSKPYVTVWLIAVILFALILIYSKTPTDTKGFAANTMIFVLLFGMTSDAFLYQNTVQIYQPKDSSSTVLVVKNHAVILGIPNSTKQATQLVEYLQDNLIDTIDLLLVEEELLLYSGEYSTLAKNLEIRETVVGNEQYNRVEMIVFDRIKVVMYSGENEDIYLSIGDTKIIKSFKGREIDTYLANIAITSRKGIYVMSNNKNNYRIMENKNEAQILTVRY